MMGCVFLFCNIARIQIIRYVKRIVTKKKHRLQHHDAIKIYNYIYAQKKKMEEYSPTN